ncbi:apelin receptor early endogenous ligand [Anguilla rostrata]|uniref:apelin receptor early endogenous ligand n=1 Tax=Anguilla anguilla TaxID=7936 RepID=UPI0015A840AA|nr:apelin receptor early endogenous ligand [Anguilla anguilla]
MRLQKLLFVLLLLLITLLLVQGHKPDFLNLRRKYYRHLCASRRCMHLHSRVPFP